MDTVAVVPVVAKPEETVKAVMVNHPEELKLLVVLEAQVFQAQSTLVVTVTQEVNKTLKPSTVEEVVPATSVVKVVPLMLEVVLVDPDTAQDSAQTNKVLKEALSVKVLLLLQWPMLKATSQDVVKVDKETVPTVASRSHTMVKVH